MTNILRKWRGLALALLTAGLGLASCADDDAIAVNTAAVKPAPDFTDARDGHVYRCIRVGNQIWTVENLAYFLPRGAADGCVTWDEKQDIEAEDLEVDTTNIVVVISDEEYKRIYDGIVDDPAHDWQAEVGVPALRFHLWFNNFYGDMFTQEEFTRMITSDPSMAPFGNLLTEQLEEARQAQRQDYINRLLAEKAQIPIDHRDAAEAANGGYVAGHGYLYTYDGALRAVPEEGGWRLPSDEDWKQLERAIGMPSAECDQMNAWRGAPLGDALKAGGQTGFEAVYAGCNGYQRTQDQLFIRKDECAYFWASDKSSYTAKEDASEDEEGDEDGKVNVVYETGIIRQLAIYSSAIWRGTTRLENGYRGMAYSVRLVRDAAPGE